MKLSDIKPNPSNPRIIKDDKFKKLVQSLKDFPKMMALRPIVVDEQNVIQGGNMRFKALLELGYKDVPDEWVKQGKDLTEEQWREFVIKDNVSFGEMNWGMLQEWNLAILEEWGMDLPDFDNVPLIDNDNFENSKNPNDVYGGNSIPVRIGNFIAYVQNESLKNYTSAFSQMFDTDNEKEDQLRRNEKAEKIIQLIQKNENFILQ